MVNIEPELRCPAPRPARLRPGSRRRFAVALALFLGLGGAPLLHVARHLWAFQTLQRDGRPVPATVLRRSEQRIAGMWWGTLQCVYASPSGPTATATLPVDQRTVLLLRDIEGFAYEEIAVITAVEIGTVKSRIHRGRLAVRNALVAKGWRGSAG